MFTTKLKSYSEIPAQVFGPLQIKSSQSGRGHNSIELFPVLTQELSPCVEGGRVILSCTHSCSTYRGVVNGSSCCHYSSDQQQKYINPIIYELLENNRLYSNTLGILSSITYTEQCTLHLVSKLNPHHYCIAEK